MMNNSNKLVMDSLPNVCTQAQLNRDIDGKVLDFDEHYYNFANINEVALMLYVSNRSSQSLSFLPSNDLSKIEFPNSIKPQIEEFLHNLNPRTDADLYREIVLQNGLILCAYLFIIVVSLFGNLLLLFVILSRRYLRVQTTNKLIVNLTVSDLMLTVFNIPLTIVRLLVDSWPLGSGLCHLGPLVQAMSVYVSTLTMVVIALDRCSVLLGSLGTRRLSTAFPSSWTNLAIWMAAGILSTPHTIFTRVIHKQTYTCVKRCQSIYPKPALTFSRAVTVFTLLTQYLVPLTIIVICYSKVGIKIWRRVQIGEITDTQRSSRNQCRKRTIAMLIFVVIVFAICWLPLNLYQLYLDFYPHSQYSKRLFILCHWFGMSSVCYNPFIYFWLNRQYSRQVWKIFQFLCCFYKKNKRKCSHKSSKNNIDINNNNIQQQTTALISFNEQNQIKNLLLLNRQNGKMLSFDERRQQRRKKISIENQVFTN